ncbi:flagellin N-terminal helical domain-containing protein [Defluviitalea phaphyphila]|uniref:flagellin N-terminal helical domain-containing protein n=1 Tax=Defluviitalea phaphyphila TaxID=1473580 RepID=UPI000A5413AC|nr:flagellin [Defluviitalea phaphyphila]
MSNMVINTNTLAINAHRALKMTGSDQQTAVERLSSGLRINRAADDAAGLAISEKMRGQIYGLQQASRNAQDGISMIQTAEGALTETHAMLQRMRELTVQAANDTYTEEDREKIAAELEQLTEEITGITEKTEFNTKTLLNGNLSTVSVYLQVGANEGQSITFTIGDMSAEALGLTSIAVTIGGTSITDSLADIVSNASVTGDVISSLTSVIDDAIELVSNERSKLGAVQNRLEHTINNVDVAAENLQASESRIRDADMAEEMMNFTKSNILQQAATAMLAQANQAPQNVLQLLR